MINNEESRYTIVVSENATEAEIASAEALRKYMNDVLGASIPDLVKDSELPIDFTRYEILFGNTNRPESQKAYDKFGGEREAANFVFDTTATKIVIAGAQQVGIDNAVKYFKTRYCRSVNQTIATNIEFFSEKEINDIKVNGIDIGRYAIKTESGALLWEALEKGAETEELVNILTETYEVDEALALTDIEKFLEGLKTQGALDD